RRSGPDAPVGQVDRAKAGAGRAARDPAALGDRATVDLLDVAGEIDRRGATDVGADRVRVDLRLGLLALRDAVRRQAARHDDLHVGEAFHVEAGTALLDEVGGHPPTLGWGV